VVGKILLKRYEVIEIVDSGGKGIVYKVKDKTEEDIKAIKLFPPRYKFDAATIEKIDNELKLAREISHRNVVKVFLREEDPERNLNFIVMEYIDGITLKKKIEGNTDNKFKEKEALGIMKQVASGLIEAHDSGVIHGDIRTKNIIIKKNDHVKICSFGQSRQLKKAIKEIDEEKFSTIFIPPEMRPDKKQENEQVDVWGFGVILYQLLIGKLPFETDEEMLDFYGVSKKTVAVVMKCLQKNPKERYKNIREVFSDLYGEEKPPRLGDKYSPQFFQKVIRNRTLLIATGFLIIVLSGLFILVPKGGDIPQVKLYKMWYSGNPGHTGISGGGIGFATSNDGINWIRCPKNPVIYKGEQDQFNQFESCFPYIVYDGELFHMLFKGKRNNENPIEWQIGYTTSEDGEKWELPEQVVLDEGKIKSPGPILYSKRHYKMWYTADDDIYYARTTHTNSVLELVRYTDSPVLKKGKAGDWDDKGIEVGSVLCEEGEYKMWYTGKSENSYKIGYATSGNGINWQKYPRNPIYNDDTIVFEMNPTVVHDEKAKEYRMYYTAATEGSEYYPIRLAVSADGIKWEKYSNDPVLDVGKDNWEKMKLFITAVKVEVLEHDKVK